MTDYNQISSIDNASDDEELLVEPPLSLMVEYDIDTPEVGEEIEDEIDSVQEIEEDVETVDETILMGKVKCKLANLRSVAKKEDNEPLCTIPKGTEVMIDIRQSDGEWLYVYLGNGKEGYVLDSLVERI